MPLVLYTSISMSTTAHLPVVVLNDYSRADIHALESELRALHKQMRWPPRELPGQEVANPLFPLTITYWLRQLERASRSGMPYHGSEKAAARFLNGTVSGRANLWEEIDPQRHQPHIFWDGPNCPCNCGLCGNDAASAGLS